MPIAEQGGTSLESSVAIAADVTNLGATLAASKVGVKLPTINTTGGLVLAQSAGRTKLLIQNLGTVALEVWYSVDGATGLAAILGPGTGNDDGKGVMFNDPLWDGPVWIRSSTGSGRAVILAY